MNYSKVKDKVLLVILALIVNGITASSEYSDRGDNYNSTQNSDTRTRDGSMDIPSNNNNNATAYGNNALNNAQPQLQPQQQPQLQQPQLQQPQLNTLRYDPNANNGALYGRTAPFPIIDSNGQVTLLKTSVDSAPQNNYGYISSENTPQYPAYMGRRLRGLPTHFDQNLNSLLMDPTRHTPQYKRSQGQQPQQAEQGQFPLTPAVQTENIDQGPLAPAPKSLMELAGWWEYLALLFGDAGDSTALRLILHRLTKLAQLQLGPIEAGRVQAACAFLADHFKPLLVNSFQNYVYDPNYARNSAMWSSDPGFSLIIRRLVDQMDFFGAQQELDRIFGPNTSVAVSFGMRQPEWLRLKLILEQITWDLKHPNDLIGLWSPTWNLTESQKLSILAYASNPSANTPLDLNLPHRDLILARINLITNGEGPRDLNLIKQETPLDQAHYEYARRQVSGNLCASKQSSTPSSSPTNNSNSPSSLEADGLKRRVDDYCETVNLTPNFVQFCQTGPNDSTPIASLLSAAGSLFDAKVITYINHLERLFWSFTWTGSCSDAREALATLTNQIKVLGPRDDQVKKGRRVPPGVDDSIHVRLEYMQAVQQTCQNNIQLTGSADAAHIFSLLNYGHWDEALAEWERRFSSVAARLEGYPGGSILTGAEGKLLNQQARDVRITLLIYKYPKAIYSPCLSKGLLTRDPGTDLTLLNLTHSLDTRKANTLNSGTSIEPLIPEMSARSLYMRALYLAGKNVQSARVAREIAAASPGTDQLVDEFLACTQLCGSETRNPCEAEKTFDKLRGQAVPGQDGQGRNQADQQSSQGQGQDQNNTTQQALQSQQAKAPSTASSVYAVGKELSSRLCRLSRNTASDALSLRYGKVLTTQATFAALKRFYDQNTFTVDGVYKSKLEAGRAESILPWFGSLPPAPVDEILSFVPTRKLKFVSQVGINGIPVIKPASNQGSTGVSTVPSDQPNTTANDKIFVLGKQYASNILTSSNGPETTQPQTKLVDGYFQLATQNGNNANNPNSANRVIDDNNANSVNDEGSRGNGEY